MAAFWEWLAALPPAVALQRSGTAYLLVNAAHILSIGVLVGSIASLDLRLLGAFRHVPVNVVAPFLSRMAAWGLGAAAITGLWLFSVRPDEYASNTAFLAKLAVVAMGVANALWLHRARTWIPLAREGIVPPSVRGHAAASLMLWAGAVIAGRWIGFL